MIFSKSSLIFLDYNVSSRGIKPPQDRITAISEFSLSKTSTDLRRFMGMLNFFRPMVPNFAAIAYSLTELLRYNLASKSLLWTDDVRQFFDNLKQALINCPTLVFPSQIATDYQLVTDASSIAVGAALHQIIDGNLTPIGFYSKKLSDNQLAYSTYDRELLAAFLAVLHFKELIGGHTVTLFLDHKQLVSSFYSKVVAKSERQQRQLAFISEYVISVHYIRGDNNVVADCLSRATCAITVDAFDMSGIARSQTDDKELDTYKDRLSTELPSNVTLW